MATNEQVNKKEREILTVIHDAIAGHYGHADLVDEGGHDIVVLFTDPDTDVDFSITVEPC